MSLFCLVEYLMIDSLLRLARMLRKRLLYYLPYLDMRNMGLSFENRCQFMLNYSGFTPFPCPLT